MSPFMSLFITSFVRIVQRNRENYIDRIVWRERERRERVLIREVFKSRIRNRID